MRYSYLQCLECDKPFRVFERGLLISITCPHCGSQRFRSATAKEYKEYKNKIKRQQQVFKEALTEVIQQCQHK